MIVYIALNFGKKIKHLVTFLKNISPVKLPKTSTNAYSE